MVERHKRLALLDAASNDREVPVKRRELIRQVAVWEVSEAQEQRGSWNFPQPEREREEEEKKREGDMDRNIEIKERE